MAKLTAKRGRWWLAAGVAGVLSAGPAVAQEALGWNVGAVGRATSSIYAGADGDTSVVPSITYQGERFSIGTRGLSVSVLGDRDSGIALFLGPRFAPYDADDSPGLIGMDRDFSVDMGLAFRAATQTGTAFEARIAQEITGEHDGQEVDLRVGQSLLGLGVPLEVFGGATWQSADLSGFLYGVAPGEARVGRDAYAPGQTITPYLGLGTRVPVGDRFAVFGSVEARFLDDDITDSPIVDESRQISARIGVTFDF